MENFKSEQIDMLVAAVVETIKSIDGVNKNSTVGAGTRSEYKGVKDQDVKQIVGKAMANNDLCMIPINIDEKREVYRWTEGNYQKQQVIYSIKAKYLLSHKSGQWIIVVGIGDGVDSQDKAAGKATTYALKNAMLYTFAVPTGNIDDTDTTHSDEIENPKPESKPESKPAKEFMNQAHVEYASYISKLRNGEKNKAGKRITAEMICNAYEVSPEAKKAFEEAEQEFLTQNK